MLAYVCHDPPELFISFFCCVGQGGYYVDHRLCFGGRASPFLYTTVTQAVEYIIQKALDEKLGFRGDGTRRAVLVHFVDDFCCIAESNGVGAVAGKVLLDVMAELGIPLAPKKTQFNVQQGGIQKAQEELFRNSKPINGKHRILWPSFTSTTLSPKVVQDFIGVSASAGERTAFQILTVEGRNISAYSYFGANGEGGSNEEEVLLLPGACFDAEVAGIVRYATSGVTEVKMQQLRTKQPETITFVGDGLWWQNSNVATVSTTKQQQGPKKNPEHSYVNLQGEPAHVAATGYYFFLKSINGNFRYLIYCIYYNVKFQ